MKFILLILFWILIIIMPLPVRAAEQALSVSPVILDIQLSPGQTIKKDITIANMQSQPMPVHLSPEVLTDSDEDGAFTTRLPETVRMASWIRLVPEDLIIDPESNKKVSLEIDIPSQIEVGGYYAMINVTPLMPLTGDRQQVVPTIGIVILSGFGVPDERPADQRVRIETFSLGTPVKDPGENIGLTLRVRNTSLHHFSAKPTISLRPLITGAKRTDEIPEKTVLPGRIRSWKQTLTNLPTGIYIAEVAVSIGGGNIVTGKTYLTVLPFRKWLPALAAAIFILFLLKYRKRLRKALQVFFSGR
ncbi:hypothetical protein A2Z33_00185 [Candidatus Gottesmanbacteria bacterium RBG_16_52_11]|uniref:Uncharacterized protein n=1 Tax=Candidatus Gottesmanbacteria bacterium RBG_16_52_11 TaxID=1798374 RepID=A0A1F5YNS0_9BACT|nr:MAG: hypothetical protein A2Z33_00185 [Candidatus Gottesmanbacteria bacterium RBG_16_52_11]